MIRALVEQTFDASKKYFVLAGLSTDSKPTTGLITGSKFLEVDTGVNYVFDEVSGTWSASTITEQEIKDEIDSWLEDNIDPDSGYALDRTLSLSNAAAPADMVGDLKSAFTYALEDVGEQIHKYNVSAYSTINAGMQSNNTWAGIGQTSYESALVTDIYDAIQVKANSIGNTFISFFSKVPDEPTIAEDEIYFCNGETGRHQVSTNTTEILSVPADCLCIVVGTLVNGTDRTPTIVGFKTEGGTIGELKNDVSKNASDIDALNGAFIHALSELRDFTFEPTTQQTVTEGLKSENVPFATVTKQTGWTIGSNGQPTTNYASGYVLYTITLTEDADIFINSEDKSLISGFLLSAYTNGSYVSRKQYVSGGTDTMPTGENPLELVSGDVLYLAVISSSNPSGGIPFHATYLKTFYSHTLNEDVRLNATQIAQTGNVKGFLKYIYGAGIQDSTERVEVYFPQHDGFIRYSFVHSVLDTVNSDIWRVGEVWYCDEDFTPVTQIVVLGEWECAIKLDGRSDFAGGILHGDEVFTNVKFFVDGILTDITSLADYTLFSTFRVVEFSNLYDPSDSTTIFAEHGSQHEFDVNADMALRIRQSLKWKGTYTVDQSYMAMLPIKKSVTNKIYTDNDFNADAISIGSLIPHTKRATIYSDSVKCLADINIPEYPTVNANSGTFFVHDNGGSTYNKCYYIICGNDVSVASGTLWKTETEYNICFEPTE